MEERDLRNLLYQCINDSDTKKECLFETCGQRWHAFFMNLIRKRNM
jgi:hypothetical protein